MHHRSILSPVISLALAIAGASVTHAGTSVAHETSVNLSAASNVYAVSNDGAKVTNGGIDTGGTAYAETLIGTSVSWGGSTFALGAAGKANGASSTSVALPAGNFGVLKMLATGVDGSQANQTFVVTYTDGSTTTIHQSLSDWFYPQSFSGETAAMATAYRLAPDGKNSIGPAYLYGYSFPINGAKTVKGLTLPLNRDVIVLAVTLVPGAVSSVSPISPVAAALVAPVASAAGSAAPVDLSSAANVYALFNNGSPVLKGGIDTYGFAISQNVTGTSVNWSGSRFQLGAAGTANAASGTSVALPAGNFGTLKMLATGVSGDQPNQTFVVHYTDGSATTIHQSFSDWFYPGNYTGESKALTLPYRLTANGSSSPGPAYLYGYSFAINGAKTVKSITLPANRDVVVLGMTLVPGAGATATNVASAVTPVASAVTPAAPLTAASVSGTISRTGASSGTGSASGSGTASSGAGSASGSGTASSGTGSTSGSGTASSGSGDPSQQIVVNAGAVIAPIGVTQIGSNLGAWFDVAQGGVGAAVKAAGARVVRWPGGSVSDGFHWQSQLICPQMGGSMSSNSTFDDFMTQVIGSGGLEAAVTVNYGSNSTCTGGADPAEAAAWVAHAKAKGYTNVHHWTVGNEVYGGWEFDLHGKPHDAGTYAAAVGGNNGFYQQMKAADSSAQVGVVVEPLWNGWDSTVLGQAKYDFVELHWYAQQAGKESDSYLLTQATTELRSELSTLRAELASAGRANTPIMVGEFNSVNESPGKQTLSIVNALFLGMTYGEFLNDNVALATAWFGVGGTCNNGNNNSSSLYGWQSFGGYDQVSAGAPWWGHCGSSSTTIPAGTVLPNGYAQQLVSQFATPGGNMLSVNVGSALPNIRAYASSNGGGYSVMIFNLSQNATTPVTINLANAKGASYSASTVTYGKAQYDDSRNNVWTAPVSQNLGTANGTVSVSMPPWSMTVLQLN